MDYLISPIKPDDAAALVEYMHALTSEPDINIPWSPGEFTLTIEEEREFITSFISDTRSQWLVATLDNSIAASCELNSYSRSGIKHMAVLGMSVAKQHRGKKLGDRMLRELFAWARTQKDIHRIELWVFARNLPAIRLYLKHGFKIEGKRTDAIMKDGIYLDDYLMGLIL